MRPPSSLTTQRGMDILRISNLSSVCFVRLSSSVASRFARSCSFRIPPVGSRSSLQYRIGSGADRLNPIVADGHVDGLTDDAHKVEDAVGCVLGDRGGVHFRNVQLDHGVLAQSDKRMEIEDSGHIERLKFC